MESIKSKHTSILKKQLPTIRKFVLKALDDNEDRCIYTNVGCLYRLEKNIQTIIKEEPISKGERHLLYLMLYADLIQIATSKQKEFDFQKSAQHGIKVIHKICEKFDLPSEIKDYLLIVVNEMMPGAVPKLPVSKIFHDALMMEFSGPRGRDRLKLFYEELLLRDIQLPQSNWYDALIGIIDGFKAHTNYGKAHVQSDIEKLGKKLKKEKKELESRKSLLLKKELNISEEEIKKLRKDINNAANRDERAIQTLFRTTIKSHYTLNEMVDRKANIMITVNSIILSVVMSGIFGVSNEFTSKVIPISVLSFCSIFSIIFAVLAIRPLKTQGDFTEEEVRNKEGNLLYFGNFHNMHSRDFEWGFLQILKDKNYLYSSMIRDFYYQGIGLNRKYIFIRRSLTLFLFGFGFSFLLYVIIEVLQLWQFS